MQIQELNLTIGDVIQVGDVTVTVIDIDGDEVTFRVDGDESHDDALYGHLDDSPSPLPR